MVSAIKEMKSELSERIEGENLLLVGDSGSPLLREVGISQDSGGHPDRGDSICGDLEFKKSWTLQGIGG